LFAAFLFFEPGKVPPPFLPLTEDHRRMAGVLKASSGLDWVAVYPPHIADTPGTNGAYTVSIRVIYHSTLTKNEVNKYVLVNPSNTVVLYLNSDKVFYNTFCFNFCFAIGDPCIRV
jgi:hypothetical protein